MRYLPALSLLAVLASGASALADPPSNAVMKMTPPAEGARPSPAQMCAMRVEMQTAQIGQLEAKLALTDKQKPLFEAWKKVRLEMGKAWPCPPPPMGLDVPMPTRLDHEESMLTYSLGALRKERPVVVALYQALTPQQQGTFDGRPPPDAAPEPHDQPEAQKPKPAAPSH